LIALSHECWRTRGIGDFWQHLLVAEGAFDIAIDPIVSLWDVAALVPIVEEAGGRWSGVGGGGRVGRERLLWPQPVAPAPRVARRGGADGRHRHRDVVGQGRRRRRRRQRRRKVAYRARVLRSVAVALRARRPRRVARRPAACARGAGGDSSAGGLGRGDGALV